MSIQAFCNKLEEEWKQIQQELYFQKDVVDKKYS